MTHDPRVKTLYSLVSATPSLRRTVNHSNRRTLMARSEGRVKLASHPFTCLSSSLSSSSSLSAMASISSSSNSSSSPPSVVHLLRARIHRPCALRENISKLGADHQRRTRRKIPTNTQSPTPVAQTHAMPRWTDSPATYLLRNFFVSWLTTIFEQRQTKTLNMKRKT